MIQVVKMNQESFYGIRIFIVELKSCVFSYVIIIKHKFVILEIVWIGSMMYIFY